ncbi:MAG: aconitate hydratase AcnA [Hyphomicrobiales bacterium]|nr:MAG: aconitate hydratase AcnA [Hyphomicrobiales bacterium]
MLNSLNSFNSRKTLDVNGKEFVYYSLAEAEKNGLTGISRLPYSLKVLLENLLRFEDGRSVTKEDIQAIADWLSDKGSAGNEIAYRPARVLMQDFTGVPAVVDLAAMRDATVALGGNTDMINPQVPVDLVIDHSVMVDNFGNEKAFEANVDREYQRNGERYTFLKWGQTAFDNFRVVPPGTGICHQVNLEYLSKVVWTKDIDGKTVAYPDTLVGTDSHTTMVNGLSVLGWGVGGIEAEAAMLGQPVTMMVPEVIGFRLEGKMPEGTTATDLVLTIVQMLRAKGVVGKFVEFFGSGLDNLTLEDQATIANMAPEYGATCGFFPIDDDTISYMNATGRDADQIALVEAYAKAQGMWRDSDGLDPVFTSSIGLDMAEVVPSISGPKRPQDRISLSDGDTAFAKSMATEFKAYEKNPRGPVKGRDYDLGNGDVVIAAITSCTNTSNPSVLIAAGLVARKARALGLNSKPWVKTSLAPGSQVVTDYLDKADLSADLDALGFNLVGYGCTTCIGNSGPLPEEITEAIHDHDLVACSVLSGNRNFEGRISQDIRANYLASPPLVVAYAIAGSLNVNLTTDPIGQDKDGNDVYLKDIWPSSHEITELMRTCVTEDMFRDRYGDVFTGDKGWQAIDTSGGATYNWDERSTYVQNPPYFEGMSMEPDAVEDINSARVLGLFADSITTDHISPAGVIKGDGPAGDYLRDHQVRPIDFNSFGSRRGNHQVMMRGTFANIRIKNQMLDGVEGGYSTHYPSGEEGAIYDVAMRYKQEDVPLVIFGGKEYGTGSSRDWAAKGTILLGVRAVIVESFERIHRSNLVGMGVLPLVFTGDDSWDSLGLTGSEQVSIKGLADLTPRQNLDAEITFANGDTKTITLLCRIDTEDELDYYRNGGILHYVLRNLNRAA